MAEEKSPPKKRGGWPKPKEPPNVRTAIADSVQLIQTQINLLRKKAETEPLDWRDAQLLNAYAKTLCALSNEERHTVQVTSSDLGKLSDEELADLARKVELSGT